jgi:chromosome partitioning protein
VCPACGFITWQDIAGWIAGNQESAADRLPAAVIGGGGSAYAASCSHGNSEVFRHRSGGGRNVADSSSAFRLLVLGFGCMVAKDTTTKPWNMKTIAIISQKGGAGKTTLGIHLAVAAEQRGMKTALFDLDPQASAASWADKRALPSPAVVSSQATRLPNLLKQAADQKADLVIIDSAPNADAASLAAARAADLILIPCRPAAFDLAAIGTTLNLASVASKPAFVVLNAVPPLGKVGEEARRVLMDGGVQVAPPLLHHLVAFAHAVNDGRTAQELDPQSKAAAEIDALFAWVKKQVNASGSTQATAKPRRQA